VSELFDARTPREIAEIADIDGVVDFGKQIVKGSRMLIIRDPVTNSEVQHPIKASKHLLVTKGDYVKKGQKLTLGAIVP